MTGLDSHADRLRRVEAFRRMSPAERRQAALAERGQAAVRVARIVAAARVAEVQQLRRSVRRFHRWLDRVERGPVGAERRELLLREHDAQLVRCTSCGEWKFPGVSRYWHPQVNGRRVLVHVCGVPNPDVRPEQLAAAG